MEADIKEQMKKQQLLQQKEHLLNTIKFVVENDDSTGFIIADVMVGANTKEGKFHQEVVRGLYGNPTIQQTILAIKSLIKDMITYEIRNKYGIIPKDFNDEKLLKEFPDCFALAYSIDNIIKKYKIDVEEYKRE